MEWLKIFLYSFYFQANKTEKRYHFLCKLFVFTQCSISLTQTDLSEHGERKWQDICLSFVHTPAPDPVEDPEGNVYLLLIFGKIYWFFNFLFSNAQVMHCTMPAAFTTQRNPQMNMNLPPIIWIWVILAWKRVFK